MISLEQVLLLEQKVESAVGKIRQLQEENDALRKKCAELTNALSSKSEQLSNYETDQNKIEEGIRKALNRLTSIENSVLKTVGSVAPTFDNMQTIKTQEPEPETTQSFQPEIIDSTEPVEQITQETEEDSISNVDVNIQEDDITNAFDKPYNQEPVSTPVPFVEDIPDTTEPDFMPDFSSGFTTEDSDDNSQDSLGFDIF